MVTSTADIISGVFAAVIGFLTWPLQLFLLLNGVGSYLGGADFLGWIFCLAPLPLGFRLLANESGDSKLLGIWLIALTPILSTIALFLAVFIYLGAGQKHEMIISIGYILLWLIPVFLKNPPTSQAKEDEPKNAQPNFGGGSHVERSSTKWPQEEIRVAPAELRPTLEALDIQKFIATASKNQIRNAHADQTSVSRFFNAIRYGQIAVVRKAVSASPLLILAKDVYGNTPIYVAKQEGNIELESFFNECLSRCEASHVKIHVSYHDA
ncbi:MAG: hypothetical protein QM739_09610 [Propionivibrio sp.]